MENTYTCARGIVLRMRDISKNVLMTNECSFFTVVVLLRQNCSGYVSLQVAAQKKSLSIGIT